MGYRGQRTRRRLLVITAGGTDFQPVAHPVPQLYRVLNPHGQNMIDLRAWGAALGAALRVHGESAVAAGLALPKIEPVLTVLAQASEAGSGAEAPATVDVVLVATDQDHPRFRAGDTAVVLPVLREVLPLIARRCGVLTGDVEVVVLRGNPTRFDVMWKEAEMIVTRVREKRPLQVHATLTGGTPALKHALSTHLWLLDDLEVAPVTTWQVQDGVALRDSALRILSVTGVRAHLVGLAQQYRFDEVAAGVRAAEAFAGEQERIAGGLCAFGQRLLDLSAEDTGMPQGVPQALTIEAGRTQFPFSRHDRDRGALDSLAPLYALMLEALAVRWTRGEMLMVLSLLHLMGEYLPILAWESTLGHAADPRRLPAFVGVLGSLWGATTNGGSRGAFPSSDTGSAGVHCPHASAEAAAADKVRSGAAIRSDKEWNEFLRHWYSPLSSALAQCATRRRVALPGKRSTRVCRAPCTVWTQLAEDVRVDLAARVRVASLYALSPLLRLRHHAPIGHFFGVPNRGEVRAAWRESITAIEKRTDDDAPPDLCEALHALAADDVGELPGQVAAFVTVVAGRPVRPSDLLARTRQHLLEVIAG